MTRPTFAAILGHVTYFLTVAIHTILFERNVYPDYSFTTVRAYNLPVRQSRHPEVCSWIQSAVAAVRAELVKGAVARVVVAIAHPDTYQILERYVFDLERLPYVPKKELDTPIVWDEEQSKGSDEPQEEPKDPYGPGGEREFELVDLTEQLRATLASISVCRRRLKSVPKGCTFTVAIELKDDADAPIGHPQAWVPVQPELQRMKGKKPGESLETEVTDPDDFEDQQPEDSSGSARRPLGSELGGQRTIPMRAVAAEGVAFELWVEEGGAKDDLAQSNADKTPSSSARSG